MAVSEQEPYKEYIANGITKSFALEFDCENQGHLLVRIDDIEPAVGSWSLINGAVVFSSVPASGKKITIQRNTPFSRNTDYQSYNNSFRPQSVNGDFDRVWLKLQELGLIDHLQKVYFQRLHDQQQDDINQKTSTLQNNINNLSNQVDIKHNQQQQHIDQKTLELLENINNLQTYSDNKNLDLKNELLNILNAHDIHLDNVDGSIDQIWNRISLLGSSSILGGKLYANTAEGLSKTKDGEFFNVVGTSNEDYAELYKNQGGVAIPQNKSYPSSNAKWHADQIIDESGKNQQEINRYVVFPEFFGATGNNVELDTTGILAAVASGATVRLQSGKNYILKTDRFVVGALNSVRIVATQDATITLIRGGVDEVFDASNADTLYIDGVNFKLHSSTPSSVILKLFHFDPTSLVNKIQVENCNSDGNFSITRTYGSQTQDPTVTPFGFKEVFVNDNNFQNTRGFIFSATDFPVYHSEFKDNTVRNFSNVAFHILTTNLTANNWKIGRISTAFVHDNVAKNDDPFWNEDGSGNYHCFLLFEGMNCSYQRNHVEGLKSKKANLELYDAYMNTRHLIHCGNTYKNNANFTTGQNDFNWLIMSKTDSKMQEGLPDDTTTTKVVTGNTYTIESDWLERLGYTSCSHKLANLAVYNAGKAIIKGNTFNINKLVFRRDPYEALTFADNTIVCDDIVGGSVFGFTAFDDKSDLSMFDNHVTVRNPSSSLTFLQGDKPTAYGLTYPWKALNIHNNSLSVLNNVNQVTNSRAMRLVQALTANISNLNINGCLSTDFSSCVFKNLQMGGGRFVQKDKTISIRPAYSLSLRGASDYSAKYYGIFASNTSFKIHSDVNTPPDVAELFYLIRLKAIMRDGVKEFQFKYKLLWNETGYSTVFTNSSDVQQTFSLGSSSGNNTNIKAISSGDSSIILGALFQNSSSESQILITGLPSYACNYEVSINVIE